MFEAIGDRACLLQISEIMQPAVTSPAAVVGVTGRVQVHLSSPSIAPSR